ncbi:MAG: prepilin peptidase [Pararhodobacter sp.]
MLMQSSTAALWFALFAAPIAAWVVWSDLKSMRIPNKAVVALVGVYAVVGVLALPLPVWGWGWLHLAVALVIGFVLTLSGGFGAGDAKFAAAMAPFVALGDLRLFLVRRAPVVLPSYLAHGIARRTPQWPPATPGWESWERSEFPMGLALGPTLIFYLVLAAIHGS